MTQRTDWGVWSIKTTEIKTMKPEELCIGDLVTFKDCQSDNPIPIKMIAIGYQEAKENCLVQIDGDDVCDTITLDDEIVGIPLTAEILEKNGFKRVRDKLGRVFYSIADDYFDLTIDEITDSIWCVEYDNIEAQFPTCRNLVAHVHELQHALKLYGIDKEIALPKED